MTCRIALEALFDWRERSETKAADLRFIAAQSAWECLPDRAFSAGRAIYLQLSDDARLWRLEEDFVPLERARIVEALGKAVLSG